MPRIVKAGPTGKGKKPSIVRSSRKPKPFYGIKLPPSVVAKTKLQQDGPMVLRQDSLDFVRLFPHHPYQHHKIGGRNRQEDRTFAFPHRSGQFDFYGVADGLGGHLGGRKASSRVREFLKQSFTNPFPNPFGMETLMKQVLGDVSAESLVKWIGDKDSTLFDQAVSRILKSYIWLADYNLKTEANRLKNNFESKGEIKNARKIMKMGTTLTACLEIGRRAYIANVGDSRAYLIRDGQARLITVDHSKMWELMVEKGMSYDEALEHLSNQILQGYFGPNWREPECHQERRIKLGNKQAREYIGAIYNNISGHRKFSEDRIDLHVVPLMPNDRIVLMTDGLLQALAKDPGYRKLESEVTQLFQEPILDNPAKTIITKAIEGYKHANGSIENLDNISVVVREPK